MLPQPVSFSRKTRPHRPPPLHLGSNSNLHRWSLTVWDDKIQTLLSRSRATNLAVLLLALFAVASSLLNLYLFLLDGKQRSLGNGEGQLRRYSWGRKAEVQSVGPARERLEHLVIVPGHGIWQGSNASDVLNEDAWILESYQNGLKSVEVFVDHIKKGVEVALEDPRSLLVFSGGQSRSTALTTEASSYLRIAHHLELFPHASINQPFPRATTEPFALDSFQNLLFSIARFKEFTSHYPSRVTVVGFGMKKRRFEELHRKAIRWPVMHWQYIGLDLKGDFRDEYDGEYLNGYLPFTRDLYGCHSVLLEKRQKRNIFSRFHPYFSSASEIARLLDYCPHEIQEPYETELEKILFPPRYALPWDGLAP